MTRRTELALLLGIVVTGVATVILGAALPFLRLRYGVTEAELGRLFAAQFAGSALAATFSLKRPRFSIICGFQFIAIGLASCAYSNWTFAPIAVLLYGIGLGLVLPSANVAVALARENTRGASLSVLNLAWGLGAAATPLLFLVHATDLIASIYLPVACLAEIIGIALLFTFTSFPQQRNAPVSGDERFDARILLHGIGFALYVGAESCVGGWTAEYVVHTFAAPRIATSAIAAFWIALLSARATTPAILSRISEPRMLRFSLVVALVGVILIFGAPIALIVTLGALCVGLGMAAVFGILVGNATTFAERERIKIPGWLFTCGSIGGATLPWLFGVVAQRTSLRSAFLLPIIALVVLIVMNARKDVAAQAVS
jgi:MFS transporter, FHS family, glucose/mannose:H+ symporter